MIIRKLLAHTFAVALGVLITAEGSSAHASEVTCKPTKVSWKQDPSTKVIQFAIFCDNVWYYARVEDSTCPAISIDSAKAWLSIATAAQLSGDLLHLYHTSVPACNNGAPELFGAELVD